MQNILQKLAILAILIFFLGCAKHGMHQAGDTLNMTSARLKLSRPGKVGVVISSINPQVMENFCRSSKKAATAWQKSVTLYKRKKSLAVTAQCWQQANHLLVISQDTLLSGEYRYEINKPPQPLDQLQLRYVALYNDPDFNSGGDQQWQHATSIQLNKEVQNNLDAQQGDATDWMRFQATAGYLVVDSGLANPYDKGMANLELYALIPDGDHEKTQLVQRWPAGYKRYVRLPRSGEYLLKAASLPQAVKLDYWLRASLSNTSPRRSFKVYDIYREVSGTIVAVLEGGSQLPVNSQVNLFRASVGKKGLYLGTCDVQQANANLATCTMPSGEAELLHGDYYGRVALRQKE